MKTKFFLLTFCLLGSISSIYSQSSSGKISKPQSLELEEVVISDSKFKLKRSQSGKPIIKITSEELKANPSISVLDVLNQKSGLEINGARSNDGQNLGYFIRGGRTADVLIIIDGIQMTNPGGFSPGYDLRFLSTNNIESIEVLKGASSVLYGSGATSAVVNIITKTASKEKISGSLSTSFGTNQAFNHQNYNIATTRNLANFSGTLGKFNYSSGLGYQYTDGISAAIAEETNESDIFSKYNLYTKLGYTDQRFTINIKASLNNFKNDFDADSFTDDPTNHAKNKQYRISTNSSYKYKKGSIHASVAYDNYNIESITKYPSTTIAHTLIVDLYNKYVVNDKFYTTLGINYQDLNSEISDINKSINITSPYVNAVYVSNFGLNLNAGLRYNNHSKYGNNLVYQINPSFKVDTGEKSYLKLFSSYGTSFMAPSLIQLSHPTYGNPNLNPETSQNFEAGISFRKPVWNFSLTYFDRNSKDRIGYDSSFKSIINLEGATNVSGFEIEVQYNPIDNMSLSANYTATNYGEKIVRIPKNKANININYHFAKTTGIQLNYQYNDSREDTFFSATGSSPVTLSAYSLLDLGIYRSFLEEKLRVHLGLNNVLNAEYMEVYGYSTRGRNIIVSLQYSF